MAQPPRRPDSHSRSPIGLIYNMPRQYYCSTSTVLCRGCSIVQCTSLTWQKCCIPLTTHPDVPPRPIVRPREPTPEYRLVNHDHHADGQKFTTDSVFRVFCTFSPVLGSTLRKKNTPVCLWYTLTWCTMVYVTSQRRYKHLERDPNRFRAQQWTFDTLYAYT
jgi:hypothetical protein